MQDEAKEWLDALMCAAASGDDKAAYMYEVARDIADGAGTALDCAIFQAYVARVEALGRDN